MNRLLTLFSVFGLSALSWAEPSWLTARGRLPTTARSEAFVGTRSLGLGLVKPDHESTTQGLAGELLYSFLDRTLEGRGSRVFVLSAPRFATASVALGGGVIVVPEGLDLGLGPTASLNLGLGGDTFHVDLALQTGFELFTRRLETRVPIRGLLGATLSLQAVSFSVMARIGADVQPSRAFAGRGEVVFLVGWR